MDAKILEKAEELARSIAGQATTTDDLKGVMKTLMKSALEQMLGAELKVHLQEERPGPGREAPVGKRRNRRNSSPSTSSGLPGSTRRSSPSPPRG